MKIKEGLDHSESDKDSSSHSAEKDKKSLGSIGKLRGKKVVVPEIQSMPIDSSPGYNKALIKKIEADPDFLNFGEEYLNEVIENFEEIFKEFYEDKLIEKIFANGVNILTKEEFQSALSPSLFGDLAGLGLGAFGALFAEAGNAVDIVAGSSQVKSESSYSMGDG
jgi:hypothetical protein